MKIKEKIMEYFRECWGKKVFTKSVSLLVAACFVVNIANLPAYAQSSKAEDELLNKQVKVKENQETVLNAEAIRAVRDRIGIADMGAVSDLGEEVVRELDKKEMAVTEVGAIVERSRDGKETAIVGSVDGSGIPQIFSGDSRRPFSKKTEEDYEYRARQVLDSGAKAGQFVETHSERYTNYKKAKKEETDLKLLLSEAKETKEVKKAEQAGIKDSKEYQTVVKKMMDDTEQSIEEVEKALEGITAEQLSVLNDFYSRKDAGIVNCAADAMSNILEAVADPVKGISKGMLALQALAVDITNGVFGKDSIKDGQLNTSAAAIKQVMKDNGLDAQAYGISLANFKEGLKEGESAVLWVDGNHYVTVTKEKDGKYGITDSNKNNGGKVTYGEENFDKVISGEKGESVDGKEYEGYEVDKNDMKAVSDSNGLEEKASEGKARVLSVAETNEILGARIVEDADGGSGSGSKSKKSSKSSNGNSKRSSSSKTRSQSSSSSGSSSAGGNSVASVFNKIGNAVNNVINTVKNIFNIPKNNSYNTSANVVNNNVNNAATPLLKGAASFVSGVVNIAKNIFSANVNNTSSAPILKTSPYAVAGFGILLGAAAEGLSLKKGLLGSIVKTLDKVFGKAGSGVGDSVNCAAQTVSDVFGISEKTAQLALNIADLFLGNKNAGKEGNSLAAVKLLLGDKYDAYSEATTEQLRQGLENGPVALYVPTDADTKLPDHLVSVEQNANGEYVIRDRNFAGDKTVETIEELEAALSDRYGWKNGGGIILAQGDMDGTTVSEKDLTNMYAKNTDEKANEKIKILEDIQTATGGTVNFTAGTDGKGNPIYFNPADVRISDISMPALEGLKQAVAALSTDSQGLGVLKDGFNINFDVYKTAAEIVHKNGQRAEIELVNDKGETRVNLDIITEIAVGLLELGVNNPQVTDVQATRVVSQLDGNGVGAKQEVMRECIQMCLETLIGADLPDNSVVDSILSGNRTYYDVATEVVAARCKELGIETSFVVTPENIGSQYILIPVNASEAEITRAEHMAEVRGKIPVVEGSTISTGIVDRILSGDITIGDVVIETLKGEEDLSGIAADDEEAWNDMAQTALESKNGIKRVIDQYNNFINTRRGLDQTVNTALGNSPLTYKDGEFGLKYTTANNGDIFIGTAMLSSLSVSGEDSIVGESGHLIVNLGYGQIFDFDQAAKEDGSGLVYYDNGFKKLLNKDINMQQMGEDLSLAFKAAQDMALTSGVTSAVYIAWNGSGVMVADGHGHTRLVDDRFRGEQELRRTIDNSLGEEVCKWNPLYGHWVIKYGDAPIRYLETVYRAEIQGQGLTAQDFVNMQRYVADMMAQGYDVHYADGEGIYSINLNGRNIKLYPALCGKNPIFRSVSHFIQYQLAIAQLRAGGYSPTYINNGLWGTVKANGQVYNIDDIINGKMPGIVDPAEGFGGTMSENMQWFIFSMNYVKKNKIEIDETTDWRNIPGARDAFADEMKEGYDIVFDDGFLELKEALNKFGNPFALMTAFCDEKYAGLFATEAEDLGLSREEIDAILVGDTSILGDGADIKSNPLLQLFFNAEKPAQYKYEMLLAIKNIGGLDSLILDQIKDTTYDKIASALTEKMYYKEKVAGEEIVVWKTAQEVLFGNSPISAVQAEVLKDILSGITDKVSSIDPNKIEEQGNRSEQEEARQSGQGNGAETALFEGLSFEEQFIQMLKGEIDGIDRAISNAKLAGWSAYTIDVNHTVASWKTEKFAYSRYVEDGIYIRTITADGRQSFSSKEGAIVNRGDGSFYKIYGVSGDYVKVKQYTSVYNDQYGNKKTFTGDTGNVCWEFELVLNRDGATYSVNLNGVNNIYLLDSDTQIEQYKAQKVSYQGNNGRGGLPEGSASQTRAIIIEDEEKYSALGAGSRVTMNLSGGKGKAEAVVVASGTEALAGSKLQVPITEETRTGFEVITGSMKYNGTGWTTAENSIFRYTDNAIADVINEVMNKLLGNAEHGTIFQLDFSDVNMTGTAGDIAGAIKGYETNKESIKYVAGADSVIKSLDGAGEVRDIPEGTVFNLSVSEKGNIGLKYAGEESMEADIVLTDTGHYSFADGVGIVNEDGTISIKDVAFKKGDFVNFWSGLGNCGQTVTTNFAFTVTDDAGTATKISAGLALSGNNQGESVLKDNLNVNFTTDAGQVIKANSTDFQAFWNADSIISFVFNKNGKTSAVISGNFSVNNAIINDKPASDTSNKTQSAGSSSSPSLNSTFDGTVYDKGATLNVTGMFKNVSSLSLVGGVSAASVYAEGSKISAGSYLFGQDVIEDSIVSGGKLVSAAMFEALQNISSLPTGRYFEILGSIADIDLSNMTEILSGEDGIAKRSMESAIEVIKDVTGIDIAKLGSDKAAEAFKNFLAGKGNAESNLKEAGFTRGSDGVWRNASGDKVVELSDGSFMTINKNNHRGFAIDEEGTAIYYSGLGDNNEIIEGKTIRSEQEKDSNITYYGKVKKEEKDHYVIDETDMKANISYANGAIHISGVTVDTFSDGTRQVNFSSNQSDISVSVRRNENERFILTGANIVGTATEISSISTITGSGLQVVTTKGNVTYIYSTNVEVADLTGGISITKDGDLSAEQIKSILQNNINNKTGKESIVASIEVNGVQVIHSFASYENSDFKYDIETGITGFVDWKKTANNTAIFKLGDGDYSPQVYVSNISIDGLTINDSNVIGKGILTTKDSVMQYQVKDDKYGTITYIISLMEGKGSDDIKEALKGNLSGVSDTNKDISAMIEIGGIQIINDSAEYSVGDGFKVGSWEAEHNTAIFKLGEGDDAPQVYVTKIYLRGVQGAETRTADKVLTTKDSVMQYQQVEKIGDKEFTVSYIANLADKVSGASISDVIAGTTNIDTILKTDETTGKKTGISAMIDFENGIQVINTAKGISFDKDKGFYGATWQDASTNMAIMTQNFGEENPQEVKFYVTNVNIWDAESNNFSGNIIPTNKSVLYTYWDTNNATFADDDSKNTVAVYIDSTGFIFSGSPLNNNFKVNCDILTTLADEGGIDTFFGLATITNAGNSSNAMIMFSNGTWIAQNGATFTIKDEITPEKLQEFANAQGLELLTDMSEFDLGVLNGKELTYIPGDTETALGYILSLQDEDTRKAGIDLAVIGEEGFTTSAGILLGTGGEFNLSLNRNNSIILKANNDIAASYSLPEGWTSDNGEDFKDVILKEGDYITVATLLKNADVTEITGKDITWRGEAYKELKISIGEMTDEELADGETYDDYGGKYYLSLQGNGSYVEGYEYTDLKSHYPQDSTGEENEFTILAGARVNITENGIFISDATVYTNGMIIGGESQKAETPAEGAETPEAGTEKTPGLTSGISPIFRGTFVGEQNEEDGSFSGTASGFFDHYSDSNIDQVFSMSTIFAVGSELSRDTEINGQKLGYDKRITGMTDNGLPVFEFASKDEETRYVRENTNYEGFVSDVNKSLETSGIELTVVTDTDGTQIGFQINGEGTVYTADTIEDFESDLMDQIYASNPQSAGIPVDMSDHSTAEYGKGREILQAMYGDYTGDMRVGYGWESYIDRYWFFGWHEETKYRTVQFYANSEQLEGKSPIDYSGADYLIDIYSDENVYYAYMMYQTALDRCDGDENAAMDLLKEQWSFAGSVWSAADESFIMTGRDAYFIDRIYQAGIGQELGRDYFSYGNDDRNWSADVHNVAGVLNGYLGTGLVGMFRNDFESFDSNKQNFAYQVDRYVDSYGGDTVIYLISRVKDGSSLTFTNFTEYLQYIYSSDGSTDFDLEAMMNHFYGGDANSYQVEELGNVLDTAEWIYDYYTNYAKDTILHKASDYVSGVDIDGLSDLTGTISNAIDNAVAHNFGSGWVMDAQGTIFNGDLTLFVSPIEGIPSGVYSLGIRNDGAYTVVDKSIDNCYGIRVSVGEGDSSFDVDFMLSVTYNADSGIAALDNINPSYIVLADDIGKITNNIGSGGIDALFENLGMDSPVGDTPSLSGYTFGSIIKQLGIDYSTGDIIASGKGTRIQVNLNGVTSLSDLDLNDTNATHFNLMTEGTKVYGMTWTGNLGDVNFDFKKGYLTSDGTTFVPSSHFSATFADVDSLKNYGSVIASRLGGDRSDGIVADSKLLSDAKLQKLIDSESFSCSPFNYQQVMADMDFGVRVNVAEGGTIKDFSTGIADLTANAGLTFDFTMKQVDGTGGYVPSYKLVGIDGADTITVAAKLHSGYHTVEGDDSLSATFRVGDNLGLVNVMLRTGNRGIIKDHMTLKLLGTTNTFDDVLLIANQDGYLTLANDLTFANGGITTSQGMTILTLNQGSVINFYDDGNVQVLKGSSDIAAGNIKVDPTGAGGPSSGQIPMSIYKDGDIIEVDTEKGIYNYGAGTIYNWTSNTASQDFNTSVFTRQGTEYKEGSIFNGKTVIKDTAINDRGTIDFGALSHTAGEYVAGIAAAVAVVAVSVIAAIATFGASLVLEASIMATILAGGATAWALIGVGVAAAVAATIFVVPSAFEHGAGIASCFETGNFDDFSSNLLGLAVDIFSAYMIGTSIGKIGANLLVDGIKETVKAGIKTGVKFALGGMGVGGATAVVINGISNIKNNRAFFDNLGKAIAIGMISGALIGFSASLGYQSFGKISAKLVINTVLDSIILIKTSQSFVENISIGNYRAAASDLLILISVGVLNPIMQYSNAVKAKDAGAAAKLDAETLFNRGKGNVTAGLVGGTRLRNALFTGLSVGIAIPLMNVMGTIAQNFMNGEELLKGIDLKGLAVQFAIGFAAGFSIGYLNPRLGYNWSVRNIWGTIGEVIYNPASVIMKGVSSGVSLMRFNILSPILNAIIAPIIGWVNNFVNSKNDSYQPFKYTNEDGIFDFSVILDSWGSQFASLGEKYDKMLLGDVHDKEGWGAVKNSFGTGFFQSHFFSMAMPGAAIFKNVSYNKAGILNKLFTIWGEGGLTALPGLLPGIGNGWLSFSSGELASMITKPINMLQYSVAEKLFGGLGRQLDEALEGSVFNEILIKLGISSFQKGNERQGLFEYVFGSAAMLFVPSAMKTNSFSTERDLAKMRADRRMGRDSETGNNILNGTIDLANKNKTELALLTSMAAKSVSVESLLGYLDSFNKFNMEKGDVTEKPTEVKAREVVEETIMAAVVGELYDRGILKTTNNVIIVADGVLTIASDVFNEKGERINQFTVKNSTLASIILKEAIYYDIRNGNIEGVLYTRGLCEDLLYMTNKEQTEGKYYNTIFSKDLSAKQELFIALLQVSTYLYNYCEKNPEAEKQFGIDKDRELSLSLITKIDPENAKVMKMLENGYIEFNGKQIAITKDFLKLATETLAYYAELTGQEAILNKVIAGLKLVSGDGIKGVSQDILDGVIDKLSKTQEQTQLTNVNQLIQKFFVDIGVTDKNSLDNAIKEGKYVELLEHLQGTNQFKDWKNFFILAKYICDKTIEEGVIKNGNKEIFNKAEVMKYVGIESTGKLSENGLFKNKLQSYIDKVMNEDNRGKRAQQTTELCLFGFFDAGNGTWVNMYMLGKIQLDAALDNFKGNKSTESLEILADASLNYTMGCLFLKGFTMSSYQYNAIKDSAAAIISGNRGTRKFVPVATGEGKTTIVAALLPVLQAKNSMLEKRTVLLADNGINVQNIFKECMEFYGTINEKVELTASSLFDMQKFDYKGGTKPDKSTILFMTYSDLAFQYVADKKLGSGSILKGNMGFLLMDEADMTLYLPKAMISEWSGSETNRKIVKFFDSIVNKNGSKYAAIQELLNNPNNNKLSFMQRLSLYKDAFTDALRGQGDLITNIKDINSTVKGIQEMGLLKYLVTGGDKSEAATQRWNDYKIIVETTQKLSTLNENTTFSQTEVNKMMLPFESLEAMIADRRTKGYNFAESKVAELKTKVTDFFTQNEDGSWRLKDNQLKDLLIMQNSLYENMYIRTAVDANPNVMKIAGMMLANNSEFRSDKSLFKYIQDDGGNLYKGYGLDTILKNSLTTMLTWKEGIDYGVQDGSVMLIQQGKMQALMPEAGLLQTAEALLRANGKKDIKITRVSPRDSSSAAIIDAVRDAYGAIGLSGTYSKAARSAMGFDELNIGSRFSELNSPDGARDRVIKGIGWVDVDYLNPALTKLCAFNEVIVDMLTVDKGVIVGLPDQTSLDLFRSYTLVLGMDKITGDQTTYYDSKISAELAAKNADSKKYKYHIGIYEQIGRGLDIKMYEDVKTIDAIAIDTHLSYKSAVEQFIGRVLGGRHTGDLSGTGHINSEMVYDHLHIKFISDNASINAMGRNKEIAQSGYLTSSRSASDYAQLVYSMVVAGGGARAENIEIAKSGAVSKAVNYNTATINTVDQLRTSVASIIMDNSSSPMTDTAACAKAMEIIKPILSDTRYYNGVTLTSEGAQAATQLVQYFTNTSVNTRMDGYSAIDKVLQLSDVTVPQNVQNILSENTSISIVAEMEVMETNICKLSDVGLIELNPYTENNLGKLISLGMIVDIEKPLSIPYIEKETDATKIENMTALERLKSVMNSNVGMIPLIANQAIQSQNTPKIVKMFTDYSNIMDRKAELFEIRKDIIESDNSKFMKVINIIPVLASQLQTNISLKLTNRNIEHLKQDVFVDIMENKEQYTNLEQLLINTSYTKNGFSFVPWSMVSVLKNMSSANNFGESISWNKAKYSRVINYVNNGNMLGLIEYLSTTQRAKIPVLSSIKDNAEYQQQLKQIRSGEKAGTVQTMLTKLMLSPISLIESVFTVFKSPALSLSDDQKTLLDGLKGKKNVTVNDVVKLANTDIPNYSATTIPTQEEIDRASGERLKTLFAIIRPDVSADKLLARYKYIRDNFEFGVLDAITVDMLADDSLFENDNFKQEYKKELATSIKYGDLSKGKISDLGYGLANEQAKEIKDNFGGSEEARKFVDGLSLGVLSDKEFGKELIKLISKKSRDGIGIKASDLYRDMTLPEKINAVYKENHASVDKKDKLGQLIESEYATKAMIYSRQEIKEIMAVMPQMDKVTAQEAVEIERILEDIIDGVTAPGEMNEAVSAVLAICKDADAIAQLIGFRNAGEAINVTREEIVSRYNEKIGEIVMLEGVGKDDMQASIKILSVARDMMVMVNKDSRAIEELNNAVTAEDIINKLVISKAVNQNVVTGLVKDAVLKADKDKPAIDVEKLRKAVTEKKIEKNAKDKLKELAAMLGNGSGRGSAANSMPVALMQLSDFRAIAAAA